VTPRLRSACRAGDLLFAMALTAMSAQLLRAQTPSPAPAVVADSTVSARPTSTTPPWLVANDGARTVTIALQVTHGPGGALINGAREGGMQMVVPLGWTVQWDLAERGFDGAT
jgi:hypothetical protein